MGIQSTMINSIIFSLLPLVASSSEWKPTCGATQRQSIINLISTDLFVRHFNSDALNSSLTECSNFHRHLCPKQGPSDSASFQGLFDQVVAIERKCTKYDVFTKIKAHFKLANQFDNFDYSNESALSALLFVLPKPTLIKIYEYTSLHIQAPGNYFSTVWDVRHWTPTIDQAKFPGNVSKYDSSIFTNVVKRKTFVDALAANIKNITQEGGGMKKMANAYLPFLKDVTDYNHIANVMYREGYEWGIARDRHHDAITKVAEEYGRALQAATWSSLDSNGETRYDRFYDLLMDIYHNTLHSDLNNIGVQNASATFSKDFYNFYLEEHNQLSSLIVLPHLRNFIAVNRAHARTIATIDLDMPNRWQITAVSKIPNALSGFFVWVCVRNMAIFDLVGHNSPDGAVFGVMAYLYGHEMYHGVERELYPAIMPDSPVTEESHDCVKSFFINVGQRFPGDKRFEWWPMEEEADLFGTQIAYGAFKAAIGSRIDDLAYPSLNISQRKLFFYANSIFGCNVHSAMTINTAGVLIDAHYEVNGRLSQVPEFQSTFQCSATDNMIFPQSQHCPVFFPTYPA